jgi:AraC-like DNA-binding protein
MDIKAVSLVNDDVLYMENVVEMAKAQSTSSPYHVIVFCYGGKMLVEMGAQDNMKVGAGQLLLIPAQKKVYPIMYSTDLKASALLISDRALKNALGGHMDIWNRAMYMKEVYVINHQKWMDGMTFYVNSIFRQREIHLRDEIIMSFIRTMLLMICEGFIAHVDFTHTSDTSTIRDKDIFGRFLTLIASERYKRRQVSYYADKLCLTPKYLSIVCQRVSGKAPMQWITESTMEDCYLMLRDTNKTVKEISDSLGFPNSSFFGQFFRRQAGMTPLDYRTKYHKNV